jgi:hypothetical protein
MRLRDCHYAIWPSGPCAGNTGASRQLRHASSQSSARLAATITVIPTLAPHTQLLLLPGVIGLDSYRRLLWRTSRFARLVLLALYLLLAWPWIAATGLTLTAVLLPTNALLRWELPLYELPLYTSPLLPWQSWERCAACLGSESGRAIPLSILRYDALFSKKLLRRELAFLPVAQVLPSYSRYAINYSIDVLQGIMVYILDHPPLDNASTGSGSPEAIAFVRLQYTGTNSEFSFEEAKLCTVFTNSGVTTKVRTSQNMPSC